MSKHSKNKVKKDKKNKHIGLKIFICILVILLILGIIFAKKVYDLDGNWMAALFGHNKQTLENLDKLYILAMGESTGMSDTIIVCSYDPKTQEASMLSIPRDTFIGDSKYNVSAYDKINSLYNNGKDPEKTLEAVNELTGLDIKNYILIDTKALTEIVDIIGGIEFDVPINMKYDDSSQNLHIDLEKGVQKLNGNQVEQLVRFRHNADGSTYPYEYGMEDFGRMRTQREVIKTIAKQTIQFKNVKELGKLIDTISAYIQTNVNLQNIKDYIPYAVNMNIENVRAEQLPGIPKYIGGISFFLHDEKETQKLVDEMFRGIVEQTDEQENKGM